jgi:catechol 2,3-dioxygenase-like lactoylglutathione lyase family enzyme
MRNKILISAMFLTAFVLVFYIGTLFGKQLHKSINKSEASADTLKSDNLILGAFSLSLTVKDLKTSKDFYENLGFKVFGGGMDKNYLIMKNGTTLIGLFQGMFEGNMLTFNPGWDENATNLKEYDDIRMIQAHLKSKGITIETPVDESTTGPAFFIITDPDGNKILLDQHR